MITEEEEHKFESELQELYIMSRHWLSDDGFFEDELRFCTKVLSNCPDSILNAKSEQTNNIRIKLKALEASKQKLNARIAAHLHILEPLVTDNNQKIEFSIIQDHVDIESEREETRIAISSLKKELLTLLDIGTASLKELLNGLSGKKTQNS